jgi:hypothetical protein
MQAPPSIGMQALQRIENRIDALLQGLYPSVEHKEKLADVEETLGSLVREYHGWYEDQNYWEGLRYYHADDSGSFDKEILVDKDLVYKVSNSSDIRWRGDIRKSTVEEKRFWKNVSALLEDRGGLIGKPPSDEDEERLKNIKRYFPSKTKEFDDWNTDKNYWDGVRYYHENEFGELDKEIIVDKDLVYKVTSSYDIRSRGDLHVPSTGENRFWKDVNTLCNDTLGLGDPDETD